MLTSLYLTSVIFCSVTILHLAGKVDGQSPDVSSIFVRRNSVPSNAKSIAEKKLNRPYYPYVQEAVPWSRRRLAAFEVYGGDDSPVISTEEISVWPDHENNNTSTDDDDESDVASTALDPVDVASDNDNELGEPIELQEKAPKLVIENERSHTVWGMWGPWSPCSRTCNGGTRRRVRKCVRGACPNSGLEEDELEACGSTACTDEIHQVEESQKPDSQTDK